ncbi:transposase [Sporolactobacillus shoreicorticis]|uniref:Transposase n=1 Tax=Sporolactobacillus shoreicorticis TaxID=1923877 RepID=A0ABW5S2G2_9BACL|nr:transposase [Sporolactobacillus shoreicorticis]MCO7128257.1 transposase [Sporolactobacillus shoreicorticis]
MNISRIFFCFSITNNHDRNLCNGDIAIDCGQKALFNACGSNYGRRWPLTWPPSVVNAFVNRVDSDLFLQAYKGGGRPAYDPSMMRKVLLYAYTQKWYSCRQIARALRENLPMMWLASQQTPDFRTIQRFRVHQMKTVLQEVFELYPSTTQ